DAQQARQLQCRIRCPVPVVPAVEFVPRTVDSEIEADPVARAEIERLTPALVDRRVAHQPDVSGKERAVLLEYRHQVRGSCFLLALVHELDVRFMREAGG